MNKSWASNEQFMNKLWTSHVLVMYTENCEKFWSSHEQVVKIVNKWHEQVVNKLWTSDMNKYWRSHEQVMY